jgi:hypothetical protein
MVFLHLWDLEMFTKKCSNNMVSPNDHVVMNHQNQTPNKCRMRPCSLPSPPGTRRSSPGAGGYSVHEQEESGEGDGWIEL